MAISKYEGRTDIIQSLDDQPNDVGGLSAAELKAKFDQFGTEFIAWLNSTHKGEIDAHLADKATYAMFVKTANQSIPNGITTAVAWDAKDSYNGEDFCEIDQATGGIKILEDGVYELYATMRWDECTNGRMLVVLEGARTSLGWHTGSIYQSITAIVSKSANSLIVFNAQQTSGSSLDILSSTTNLWIRRVAK